MRASLRFAVLLIPFLWAGPAQAQTGAATSPAPPPDDLWSRVKFGATLEGYYQDDWNEPDDRVIPLRAYDTRADTFSLQQAAVVVDASPDVEKNRRAGLRVDFQFGQAVAATQGSAANEPRPDLYRNVWQAYGTYVFPVGHGLQVDFGKFASNLGYETNYARDNVNFSRALLFNFLPYYHMGVRTALPVTDRVTLIYMLTNGIQQTEEFNNFKSSQVTAIVKPAGAVTWTTSYYAGQDQPDGANGWFRVFDTQAAIAATSALSLGLDVTHTTNQVTRADPSLSLDGVGVYARYQMARPAALAIRYERLDDEGLFAGIAQVLQEVTLTAEYKLADGFLARGEFRRDWSNQSFFPVHGGGTSGRQNTALVGVVWWIGSKTGSW